MCVCVCVCVCEAIAAGLELQLKARMHPGALTRCLFSFKIEGLTRGQMAIIRSVIVVACISRLQPVFD